MQSQIVVREQMTLLGMSFFGDPFRAAVGWSQENEIGRLWSRFEAYLADRSATLRHVRDERVAYELHIDHAGTHATGEYEVFVGLEITALEDVPVQLLVKILPPGEYAVFTLQGAQITADWHQQIYAEWLPAAGYEPQHGYMFERYDERFKGMDRLEESTIEVHIPVRRHAGANGA
jgi:predicted transcriptional regulator YdeE